MEAAAHGSRNRPQVRCWCQFSSLWQLRCLLVSEQPFPGWNLHTMTQGVLLEAHGAPNPANSSVVEGKGAGVGLEQLTCLKGQPMEESRSRNTWAEEASVLAGVDPGASTPMSREQQVGCVFRAVAWGPGTQETRPSLQPP